MEMKTLPVVIFTKNRTGCAVATVNALMDNLSCSGRELRFIVSDDQSMWGHLKAVLRAFNNRGVPVEAYKTDDKHHGLGASMNNGLQAAFANGEDFCLRLEDDWLLRRPLDLGSWLDQMDRLEIGSLRLATMFRDRHELQPFPDYPELSKVVSDFKRTYTFNHQIALISRRMYDLIGKYPENVHSLNTENYGASKWVAKTNHGRQPPYVAWPSAWPTYKRYNAGLPFVHIGVSISGHQDLYPIPAEYMKFNDPIYSKNLRHELDRPSPSVDN